RYSQADSDSHFPAHNSPTHQVLDVLERFCMCAACSDLPDDCCAPCTWNESGTDHRRFCQSRAEFRTSPYHTVRISEIGTDSEAECWLCWVDEFPLGGGGAPRPGAQAPAWGKTGPFGGARRCAPFG